jgi:hypothetical protein
MLYARGRWNGVPAVSGGAVERAGRPDHDLPLWYEHRVGGRVIRRGTKVGRPRLSLQLFTEALAFSRRLDKHN